MDGYSLPPDLEQFAIDAVASGRFRDVNDVVRAGLDMLRRREAARTAMIATLAEAEAEAERDGTFTIEQVAAELDDVIAEATRRRAWSREHDVTISYRRLDEGATMVGFSPG